MAIDLANLIDSLRYEVSPPGTDAFPNAIDDEYLSALINAFWEIRLYGMLTGYEENAAARGGEDRFTDGIVTPVGSADDYDDPDGWASTDLTREYQQLVVLWAAYNITLARMGSMNSVFRARAGPVEYETQQGATITVGLLKALKDRIDTIIDVVSSWDSTTVAVLDSVIERSYAIATGDAWWTK